ncbi:MAG: OsmC family protein [Halanaeroarchaeum sp.]
MVQRTANAVWNGTLKRGDGQMAFGSGAFEGAFSYASRFENGEGTNPEELLGAAHAGCFSMAFANELDDAGYDPASVETTATITLSMDDGPEITRSHLETEATVPDIDEETFQEIADGAKEGCPVSQALAGVEITLDATLV